jgi:hypothetical protein
MSAWASSASASPGMSLSGRRPEIEKSGATASSAAAPGTSSGETRAASSGNRSSIARNNIAAATMARAPPASDHTARATASTRNAGSDGISHDSAASETWPRPM